jgi:hypothetical protein
VADRLFTVVGLEATSETVGHYNAYPLEARPGARRGGAPEVAGLSPGQIIDALRAMAPDLVVQINHPRSGYFELAGFDPTLETQSGFDFDFDAVEVINGKRLDDTVRVLVDWFWLLEHGHVVTAMGNSDSHDITPSEVGYPRTYLGVGFDDPARLTDALIVDAIKNRRDIIATNGPFITLRAADGSSAIGATLREKAGTMVSLTLLVQAPPWVDVTSIQVIANGVPFGKPIPVTTPRTEVIRHRSTLELPSAPGAWYVILVQGAALLDPVVPDALPFALTNPIWIHP